MGCEREGQVTAGWGIDGPRGGRSTRSRHRAAGGPGAAHPCTVTAMTVSCTRSAVERARRALCVCTSDLKETCSKCSASNMQWPRFCSLSRPSTRAREQQVQTGASSRGGFERPIGMLHGEPDEVRGGEQLPLVDLEQRGADADEHLVKGKGQRHGDCQRGGVCVRGRRQSSTVARRHRAVHDEHVPHAEQRVNGQRVHEEAPGG